MALDLNSVFGTESLSAEQFTQKCAEKGIKLADLATGQYVDKGKYDDLEKKHSTAVKERDDAVRERDDLKSAAQAEQDVKTVTADGCAEEFAEFVLYKAKKDVTDKVDLKAATKAYLAEHPQYAAKKKPTVTKVSSQGSDKGDAGENNINNRMNKILRGE